MVEEGFKSQRSGNANVDIPHEAGNKTPANHVSQKGSETLCLPDQRGLGSWGHRIDEELSSVCAL